MTVPIIFAFDENYALPASIAIRTLVESKNAGTEYDIIVLHGGLSRRTRQRMETIAPIRWIRVDRRRFAGYPKGWSGEATWYRLLLADALPEYDKVVWSDVDVLFKCDLSETFGMALGDSDWSGVTECIRPNGTKSSLPGFMVVNTRRWRETRFLERCEELVRREGPTLRMFDLDVLNRIGTNVLQLDPSLCVFERLLSEGETAPEFGRMVEAYGREAVLRAIADPKIIHYAGPPMKVWLRRLQEMPPLYREAIVRSPFWDKDREKGGWKMAVKLIGYMIAYGLTGQIRFRRQAGVCRRSV